jgi:hypothetical protein
MTCGGDGVSTGSAREQSALDRDVQARFYLPNDVNHHAHFTTGHSFWRSV